MPTGQEIMQRAGVLLNDTDHIRWPLTQLCDWINEACRAIVLAKPSASSKTIVLTLVKGTYQTVPQAGTPTPLMLVSVIRNMLHETDRSKGGRAITITNRAMLDAQMPDWHNERSVRFKKEVRHYVYDEATPLEFYVYPGNDGTGLVEAAISTLPVKLTASGADDAIGSYAAVLGLPEPYSVPILDYVLYRAFAVDDIDGAIARSVSHYQQFAAAVGLKIQIEKATTPNQKRVS